MKLKKAQDEFIKAKASYGGFELMDDREKIYIGTHGVDSDVNDTHVNPNGRKKANNVVNISFELIESQVDPNIPQPSVKSKRKGYDYQAQVIEDSTKNDLLESDIYRINDENERTTPIQGFSIITVSWNPDFENHLYRGEIELDNNHPKTLIPQPGIYNLQKMDMFWIMASVTPEYVKKRYGIELSDDGEEYPEINSIDSTSDNNNGDTEKITIITKWYKNNDGKIGKYTWVNDTELEDLPNYFLRRNNGELEEYETLEYDIVKSDGSVIPAMSPKMDDDGQPIMNPVMDEFGQPMLDMNGQPMTEPELEPTRIKYFCPTRYPVVIRRNVPLNFNFGGQSDIDIIRDQADAIKKVISTIEEKILRGGFVIKAKKGHQFNLKNALYQVIRGEPDELQMLDGINLQANIQQDLQFAQEQYKSAQYALGITDSFQGKPDPTAQSGIAKQIQVFQSSGRMQSKIFNKRNAFKELFEIMFEFKLAFYDEVRPYMKQGQNGETEYGEFNKYDFLEQDAAGEWYYNTDFLFSADAGEGIPKDKMWLMNQTLMYTQAGLLNKVQFWSAMEKFGYPGASDFKVQAQEEIELQQQMSLMQQEQSQQQQAIQQSEKEQQSQMQNEDRGFKKQTDIAKLMQNQMKMDNSMKGGV